MKANIRLPFNLICTLRRHQLLPSHLILTVNTSTQSMRLFERDKNQTSAAGFPNYSLRKTYRISSSAYGLGQQINSNQTPLGLHRVAAKIGGGQPTGTVFRSRQVVGLTWQGLPNATIVHRILWLEGLEPGHNRGGEVDTYNRYVYIHGCGDETTLGRPQSHGCIHVAAQDLIPLFDRIPAGAQVWIAEG